MTPAEFRARASLILGGWGWQTRLAHNLGHNPSTIRKWLLGYSPVPEYVVAVIELLEAMPRGAALPERWTGCTNAPH